MSDPNSKSIGTVGELIRRGDIRRLDRGYAYYPTAQEAVYRCETCHAVLEEVQSADGYIILECPSCHRRYLPPVPASPGAPA